MFIKQPVSQYNLETAISPSLRCRVLYPSEEKLRSLIDECDGLLGKVLHSSLNSCECLLSQKKMVRLTGVCPMIGNRFLMTVLWSSSAAFSVNLLRNNIFLVFTCNFNKYINSLSWSRNNDSKLERNTMIFMEKRINNVLNTCLICLEEFKRLLTSSFVWVTFSLLVSISNLLFHKSSDAKKQLNQCKVSPLLKDRVRSRNFDRWRHTLFIFSIRMEWFSFSRLKLTI